jgi:hypothetical protein
MQNHLLPAALNYASSGFSVIPVQQNKKPCIAWQEYQTRRSTADEIREWWGEWPSAMIGIVTGEISGVLVIDCDTQEGYHEVEKLLPDALILPIARTPRGGWHLWFIYPVGSKITVGTGIVPGVDFRGEGGYIIAPPSVNAKGKGYTWQEGLALGEVGLATVPEPLYKYISLYTYRGCKENVRPDAQSLQFLTQGTRDNDLFHVGNCLIKGGCKENIARQVLIILAKDCIPPFSEKDAQSKIDSVLARCERRERNLTEDLRRWIDLTSGYFSLTEAYDPLQIVTSQKNAVHQIMHRFVKEGYVERHPNKNGIYRRIDREVEFMDFANADTENTVDLLLPLDLHNKTRIFPKSTIVIAGVSGMGKTLFAFNAIANNMGRFPIFYFNSEMGPEALKYKLSHFPIPMTEWEKHMKVVDQWDFYNIADKVQPDAFNVIDYLEPEGEKAFNIHGVISAIIRRLNKGTALITIQKKPAAAMGTGGIYSVKAATLALALDWGKIEIVKNRFRESDPTPSLNKIKFEVHQGYKFVKQGGWY